MPSIGIPCSWNARIHFSIARSHCSCDSQASITHQPSDVGPATWKSSPSRRPSGWTACLNRSYCSAVKPGNVVRSTNATGASFRPPRPTARRVVYSRSPGSHAHVSPGVPKVLVDELHRHPALADRGGNALGGPVPHIARGEDPGDVGLERERVTVQGPAPGAASVGEVTT